jgi:hypothetical protein
VVLLMAALPALSACAGSQAGGVPELSQSKEPKAAPVKRVAAQSDKARSAPAKSTKGSVDPARIRALAAQAAPDDPAEQERLFREFMEWNKSRQKR